MDTYKALSEVLAPDHRVQYHGGMLALLLADVCGKDNNGPVLSAIVVNGQSKKPGRARSRRASSSSWP
ncbi:hypothetical protein [Streptantibioticus ferralitis]|uniref:Uncharacterized protein n=1 Tax=Streptantibioticus ferralitis TaxID=236510 RepID=A0ABT5Z3M0_9ACTN|nr:hypothetical protein [Streptantibioticus ferralitis]MDF2258294.1 hypothetical protein [Streptantibioticus ferralitis]